MAVGPRPSPELTETDIVELYGDAPVAIGTRTMLLSQALAMEAMAVDAGLCPDTEARRDPDRRLAFLAGMLASAGSLQPEHQYLLPPPPVTPS